MNFSFDEIYFNLREFDNARSFLLTNNAIEQLGQSDVLLDSLANCLSSKPSKVRCTSLDFFFCPTVSKFLLPA